MSKTKELLELIQKAGLHQNQTAHRLLQQHEAATSQHTQKQTEKALKLLATQHTQKPFQNQNNPPKPANPEIQLHTLSLTETELTQHTLITGRSGAGKTNLINQILTQVDAPWWSFDLKQDYRHLLPHTDHDITVFPAEQIRLNPVEPPPGVTQNQWTQTFAAIFADSQALLNASENFTKKSLRQFSTDLQTFTQNNTQPSLPDILENIENQDLEYKQGNYRDTVSNRLQGITSDLPQALDTRKSMDLVSLLDKDVVFELDGLASTTQNFVMETLLAWIYQYRKAQNHRGNQLRHLVVADEGKTMFSRKKEQSVEAGIPTIDQILAKLREFGEGVIVGDQESRKLTESLKANTYTTILLSTATDKELSEMSQTLGLNEFQRKRAEQLSVGEAIAQKAGNPADIIQIPEFHNDKNVTDTDIQQEMQESWDRYTARAKQSNEGRSTSKQYQKTKNQSNSTDQGKREEAENGNRSLTGF